MAEIAVRSEVVGTVAHVAVRVGDLVAEGDEVFMIEAMKMHLPVLAPASGTIAAILVGEGETVGEGQVLARLAR